jgi:hypothetical protein
LSNDGCLWLYIVLKQFGWIEEIEKNGYHMEIARFEVSVVSTCRVICLAFIEITLGACNEDDAPALDKEQYAII